LGKLSAARLVLGASAPVAFAAMIAVAGLNMTLIALIAIGIVAVVPLVVLRAHLRTAGRLRVLPAE
jgi:hypothetical protein